MYNLHSTFTAACAGPLVILSKAKTKTKTSGIRLINLPFLYRLMLKEQLCPLL